MKAGKQDKERQPMAAITPRKKQLIWLAPIMLLLVVMGINITLENARSYKEITLGERVLFIPKTLITEPDPDLMSMVRDHLSTSVTNRLQITRYADEMLPDATEYGASIAGTSVIWTIEPAPPTGTNVNDLEFSADTETGLFRARDNENTRSLFYADKATNPSWISQCIEFKGISPGKSWGRCSYEFTDNGFLVRLHYDGRLVARTGDLEAVARQMFGTWLTEPEA
jgi:hypothetical protein